MTIYRSIPFFGGDRLSPHECAHKFGDPFYQRYGDGTIADDLTVTCAVCRNTFSVVEDQRNRPASWWRQRREQFERDNPEGNVVLVRSHIVKPLDVMPDPEGDL